MIKPNQTTLRGAEKLNSSKNEFLAISCMKDEAAFILEWVAYHLAVGFDHFLIFTNDCTDGTDKMWLRLQELGLATHVVNENPGTAPQKNMLHIESGVGRYRNWEWAMFFDVDEFINLKLGNGTLRDLLDQNPSANSHSLAWRLFGDSEIRDYDTEMVITKFDRAASPQASWPRQCAGFKTLFKTEICRRLGVHRPKFHAEAVLDWRNGSGKEIGEKYRDRGWSFDPDDIGRDYGEINHYAVRTRDCFLLKNAKGLPNGGLDRSLRYWDIMCRNEVVETSISRHVERTVEILKTLRLDDVLAKLEKDGQNWRQRKINELNTDPSAKEFKTRTTLSADDLLREIKEEGSQARALQNGNKSEIVSFWLQDTISELEYLCIKSWLKQGHPVTIYSFGHIANLPEGVVQKDAADILPRTELFYDQKFSSPAPFADRFRVLLLRSRPGVIWLDMDVFLLQPMVARGQYLVALEARKQIGNAIMALPIHSNALKAYSIFLQNPFPSPPFLPPAWRKKIREARISGSPIHVSEMPWGTTGPRALTYFLNRENEGKVVFDENDYYPLRPKQVRDLFDPNNVDLIERVLNATAVHLIARRLRRHFPKDISEISGNSALGRLFATVDDRFVSPLAPPPWKPETKTFGMPSIMTDVFSERSAQGSIARVGSHTVTFLDVESDTLCVSFEHLGLHRRGSTARSPWLYSKLKSKGMSVLGVNAHLPNWYRDEKLINYLEDFFNKQRISRYKKVLFTGTSMGGFGALAFSALVPGSTVVAFAPQATLDPDLAPWETRFMRHKGLNWKLPYSSPVNTIDQAGQVYLFYDRFVHHDSKHASFFQAENVTHVNCNFMGHQFIPLLNRMNVLDQILEYAISDTNPGNPNYFGQLLRRRRQMPAYSFAIKKFCEERNRPELGARYRREFLKIKKAEKAME